MQVYSNPERETEDTALPDIEVFQLTAAEVAATMEEEIAEFSKRHEFRLAGMSGRVRDAMLDAMVSELEITGGWFWQSCFPGCLPDGEPVGPFKTWQEAKADAQNID